MVVSVGFTEEVTFEQRSEARPWATGCLGEEGAARPNALSPVCLAYLRDSKGVSAAAAE